MSKFNATKNFYPQHREGKRVKGSHSSHAAGRALVGALIAVGLAVSTGRAAAPRTIVVSPDRAQSRIHSVNAAIRSIPSGSRRPVVILIRPGIYHQRVVIPPHAPPITLLGVNAADTILVDSRIAYQKGKDGKPIGTFSTASTWIRSDNFSAANITFVNDAGISGNGYNGQALAIRVDGDRSVFDHCRFLGWQDTILLNKNRQYFSHCRIVGAVDFIFGNATAYFNHCHIVCLGYGCVTAPRTPHRHPFGFVFNRCRISSFAKKGDTWLGRPWGPYASSIFLHCHLSASLNTNLFQHWTDKRSPETARFGLFQCTSPQHLHPSAWIKQISPKTASKITVSAVLAGSDRWNPQKIVRSLAGQMRHYAGQAP